MRTHAGLTATIVTVVIASACIAGCSGDGLAAASTSGGESAATSAGGAADIEARWASLMKPVPPNRVIRDPYGDLVSGTDAPLFIINSEPIGRNAMLTSASPMAAPLAAASAQPSATEEISCIAAFGPGEGSCPPFTGKEPSALAPDWMRAVVENTAERGCKDLGLASQCTPTVRMSADVGNAVFCFRGAEQVIWYNWSRLEEQRSLFEDDDLKFRAFIHGVLAHEYGHYLDSMCGKGAAYASTVGELMSMPEARELSEAQDPRRAKRRELFADSIAGCILSKLEMSADPVSTVFIRGIAAGGSTHPPAILRRIAVADGWARCRGSNPPNSVLAAFPM